VADSRFANLIAALKRQYGSPTLPPAKGPFELVLWENAAYLLSDERRAAVLDGLRTQVGLDPHKIQAANRDTLLALAKQGGMRPETRVFRWLEIARITIDQFGGDLASILKLTYKDALRALKQFPNIGEPGAEKILLYCGVGPGLPLDWNGSRVLLRMGYGRESSRNYGAQYRSIQEAVAKDLPRAAAQLARAHLLLRQHGKEVCRDKRPLCEECPAGSLCPWPAKARF
jgi:endonuclease-3